MPIFLWGITAAMCLSAMVFMEPAPIDACIMVLLFVGLLCNRISLEHVRPLPGFLLLLLVLANVLSMEDPLDLNRAFWYVAVTLYLVLSWVFFVAVFGRYGKKGISSVLLGYTVAACSCSILGILSYFRVIGFQSSLLLYGRPKGTFKDPNVFGPFLIPIAIFAIADLLVPQSGRWKSPVRIIALAVSSAGVLLSFSRAAWINYIISTLIYVFAILFLQRKLPRTTRYLSLGRLLTVTLIAVCLVVGLLQTRSVKAMMAQRITSSGLHQYDLDRFYIQRLAIQAALDHPLGIGPGQAEQMFTYATHSSYVRVLSENGFLGLTFYCSFLGFAIYRCFVMCLEAEDSYWLRFYVAAFALLAGNIINSFFLDTVHWRHYWLLLALPWTTARPRTSVGHALSFSVSRELSPAELPN